MVNGHGSSYSCAARRFVLFVPLSSTVVDGPDRRNRMLRVAAQLFVTHGYAGVSMAEVGAVVGGSKSTLYRYFADKTELFRAAVQMKIDELSGPLRAFRPGTADVAATLEQFGHHFAAIVLDPEAIALHRLVESEAVRIAGIGQTFLENGPFDGIAIMGNYLRGLCEAGVIDVADPMLASGQLFQAMLGTLQMRLLMNADAGPTRAEVEASISQAVRTFLHGTSSRTSADSCKQS